MSQSIPPSPSLSYTCLASYKRERDAQRDGANYVPGLILFRCKKTFLRHSLECVLLLLLLLSPIHDKCSGGDS